MDPGKETKVGSRTYEGNEASHISKRALRILTRLRLWRKIAATLLVLTGLNHALLALRGVPDVTRHAIFVGINIALGALVIARPRWALVPTALVTLQQLHSHGSDLVRSVTGPAPFDWASLLVVLFFPTLVGMLVYEARSSARVRHDELPH